jgi:hypothetical protein
MHIESHKSKIRLVSAGVGAVIFLIALALQALFPDRVIAVQISVWSLIVITTMILINHRHYGQRWFWQALIVALLLHIWIIVSSQKSLPFSGLGVVILIGYAEGTVFQFVFLLFSARSN